MNPFLPTSCSYWSKLFFVEYFFADVLLLTDQTFNGIFCTNVAGMTRGFYLQNAPEDKNVGGRKS
jgi:hypothetical protein